MIRKRAPGQVIVFVALLIPVIVTLFLLALGLSAVLNVRAHARHALGVATRAGAREVEYAGYGQDSLGFNESDLAGRVEQVFHDGLALDPAWLDAAPEEIDVEVAFGYGRAGAPWASPYTGRSHDRPTVAARARVPIRVLGTFAIVVPIVSETEVR